jgi:pyruvate,water dikinase
MDGFVIGFDELRMNDNELVGGKNATLGEMIGQLAHLDVRVPGGFATTSAAYRGFLAAGGLAARIQEALDTLDFENLDTPARLGKEIRGRIAAAAPRMRDRRARLRRYAPSEDEAAQGRRAPPSASGTRELGTGAHWPDKRRSETVSLPSAERWGVFFLPRRRQHRSARLAPP